MSGIYLVRCANKLETPLILQQIRGLACKMSVSASSLRRDAEERRRFADAVSSRFADSELRRTRVDMAAGFVGSTKSFPFSFDNDVEEDPGRATPRLNKRIGQCLWRSTCAVFTFFSCFVRMMWRIYFQF